MSDPGSRRGPDVPLQACRALNYFLQVRRRHTYRCGHRFSIGRKTLSYVGVVIAPAAVAPRRGRKSDVREEILDRGWWPLVVVYLFWSGIARFDPPRTSSALACSGGECPRRVVGTRRRSLFGCFFLSHSAVGAFLAVSGVLRLLRVTGKGIFLYFGGEMLFIPDPSRCLYCSAAPQVCVGCMTLDSAPGLSDPCPVTHLNSFLFLSTAMRIFKEK